MISIKQRKHIERLASLNKGRKLSEKQICAIREAVTKKHPAIIKICINCNQQFYRKTYTCGIQEPFPRFSNRKYCSLYCARHSTHHKEILKRNTGRGNKNPNWHGGKKITQDGYISIWTPHHPYANQHGCVPEHRLVMEKKIKRFLKPSEVVHHINEIKNDNRPENLQLFKNTGYHLNHHLKYYKK